MLRKTLLVGLPEKLTTKTAALGALRAIPLGLFWTAAVFGLAVLVGSCMWGFGGLLHHLGR